MYTTKVNQDELIRPFPWFIQSSVEGGRDVTCVYIKGDIFFYYCDYNRGSNAIDWRTEINKENQSKWFVLELKDFDETKKKICNFMNELQLNY